MLERGPKGAKPSLTLPVDLAVAEFLVGAIDRFHAKNNMPQKLHNTSTNSIRLIRIDNPLPDLNIILLRTLVHLISRHSELRATSSTDQLRHQYVLLILVKSQISSDVGRLAGVQRRRACPREELRPHFFRDVLVVAMVFLTTRVPIAAEVDVAVLLDEGGLEGVHGGDVVVERRIHVPCH